MDQNPINKRCVYSLPEFAEMMGRHRSWAYRQVSEGRIKVITGFGKAMIPAAEVDRILNLSKTQTIKS